MVARLGRGQYLYLGQGCCQGRGQCRTGSLWARPTDPHALTWPPCSCLGRSFPCAPLFSGRRDGKMSLKAGPGQEAASRGRPDATETSCGHGHGGLQAPLRDLPRENWATLRYLMRHLRR